MTEYEMLQDELAEYQEGRRMAKHSHESGGFGPGEVYEFEDGNCPHGCPVNGTEWTEPGQGSTVNEFFSVFCARMDEPMDEEQEAADERACSHVLGLVSGSLRAGNRYRTNLRLTGAPLTAEDIKRIAEAR